MKSKVLIIQGRDYSLLIQRALKIWNRGGSIFKGKFVFIKPNWVSDHPRLLKTNPELIQVLVEAVTKHGAKRVVVGENPAIGISSEQVYNRTGWGETIEKAGGELINLDEEPYAKISLEKGFPWKEISIPEILLKSDLFINVPVVKTHCQGVVSLGIKNLIGLLEDEWKKRYHREDLHYKAVAVLSVLKPHLTFIDGVVAGEGQGPTQCDLVDWGVLFLGNDPVATDAVCSACMGFNPAEVPTTRIAHSLGLGTANLDNITIKGEKVKEVFRPFKRAILGLSGRYPCEVRVNGACEGCIAWLQARMDCWSEEGIWPKVIKKKKMILAVGCQSWIADISDIDSYTILAFGDCVPKEIREHPRALFIPGCPPTDNIAPILENFLRRLGINSPVA